MTLTSDLHNLAWLSVAANEYSLSVLSKLFNAFIKYRGNHICPDEQKQGFVSTHHQFQTLTVSEKQKVDFASTWMPLPPQRPAATLTVDLQKLIWLSLGSNEYSLSVLSKLFNAFMRYCGNHICLDKQKNGQRNAADGQRFRLHCWAATAQELNEHLLMLSKSTQEASNN